MSVKAKFKVQRIERSLQNVVIGKDEKGASKWGMAEVQTVVLNPVTGNSEENSKFYASTPSGEIKIGVLNLEVAGLFELGKEYYVTFDQAG
jgi:hypothetical protein